MKRHLVTLIILVVSSCCTAQGNIQDLAETFVTGYSKLNIPALQYDYRDYLKATPAVDMLDKQAAFFSEIHQKLTKYDRRSLAADDRIVYDHLEYELANNIGRIKLQKEWLIKGRQIPEGGLFKLDKDYYTWTVQQYTSVAISPEEVYAYGESEVKKVKREIAAIQKQMGYPDSASFYQHLNGNEYYITDKQSLIKEFERIDSIVRIHLPHFIGTDKVPAINAMEWPGATAQTPPGMYLNRSYNAYGKDVFQFNFFTKKYNKRAIEWLYMHEAIPGHHLQFSVSKRKNVFEDLFYYPANFEGWGCYVEYFGKDVGLFRDPYSYWGKGEWDLGRSARLVIDVGIHYYGWSRTQALDYWKQTVPNQNEIADREVTRVTNWPGQALSYKIGAAEIFKMQADWQNKYPDKPLQEFYQRFLSLGGLPISVIRKNIIV